MRVRLLVFLLLVSTCLIAQRQKYNFNSDWRVIVKDDSLASSKNYNDNSWKKVTLPWAWNEDDAFKKDIVDLSTGIAWYRKKFKLPASAKGKKVFLEFEGIRQGGEFYLNGKHIGRHENGVTSFGFDVSDGLAFGDVENVIAARIDNSWDYREKATNSKYQWEDRNFNANYGGIQKNVFLHITNPIYQTLPLYSNLGTTGVYIYADDYSIKTNTAKVHAESEIKNETGKPQQVQYEVRVAEQNGKLLKSFTGESLTLAAGDTKIIKAAATITGLQFWSWGFGYLYDVTTVLKVDGKEVDKIVTKTGFRKTAFKNGMIYLNDRVIQVHGYAQRTSNEWPAIGMSVPAWLSDYSNRLMVESNGNLVRWMHITPWKQDIESCDRVGLMQAMPAGDAEKDVEGVRWTQRTTVMRDAIIYNRNNPSIIFYECGNESISEAHMKEMKAIRDGYDPFGGRAIGSREMLDSKTAEYGGEMLYINKSANIPLWAMEYSRDEGLRKYWDDFTPPFHKDGEGPLHKGQDASTYNRNQDSHAKENIRRWYEYWKERPGTGKRVSSGGVNIVFSETNTHHRGAENYRRSGEVDALRIKKENFYSHQVMWDGWVDVNPKGIHIIGHWNYTADVVKDIDVIAAADKVELFVNNKSLGFGKQSDRFLFTFPKVQYVAGTISAVGYDAANKKISETKIVTAGKPYAIKLTPMVSPNGLQANGHDLALVEVEVVDNKGNRCPTALNTINFSLNGNAEWRGGMAQGPDNFILSKVLPVECGVNRVLIRSTTAPGTIVLKAKAEGLQPASINLVSKKVATSNGLSLVMPAENLPSNLAKGPTPLTPSYKNSRIALEIVKANAGANTDSAYKSFDDNELSDWYNDGRLNTAWMEYELGREATVSEVTIKLNNFRSRSYPIRITVDGKEVFVGNTQTSLGYFTAICKPQSGKKVRIELTDAARNRGTNTMVEVGGQKLDDGVARDDSKAKGTLSLIEVEIYENAKN